MTQNNDELKAEITEVRNTTLDFMIEYAKKHDTSALVMANAMFNMAAQAAAQCSNNIEELEEYANRLKSMTLDFGIEQGLDWRK